MTKRFSVCVPLIWFCGCTEYAYTSQTQKDVFQQERRNTVDVLMVVDNSCSMAEEQEKLAENFDSFISAFAGVDVDWQMSVITTDTLDEAHQGHMLGGDDEIIFMDDDGHTLDQVAFDSSWAIEEGIAMQLDASISSQTDNDLLENWCPATASFGDGDLGSPGDANGSCSRQSTPSDTAEDTGNDSTDTDTGGTGTATPAVGDVIITEFLSDPLAVLDEFGEWVELTNLTTEDLDLSGYMIEDSGRNSFTFPEGTTIAAGEQLIVGRSTDTSINGGASVDVAADSDMTLNNDVMVLTSSTEGAGELFGEMVAVGVTGSGIEMGYEAAALALSEPLISGENAAFLREDANLSLIFISDENDFSPESVNDYLRAFKDTKGDEAYRDNGLVNVSAVVGKEEPEYSGLPSCESAHAEATYGIRYVDLADRTDGALESICDDDFSSIALNLGLTVSGLKLEFELSQLADESTLKVKLYADEDERSLIDELEKDVEYSYNVANNSIVFEATQVPASETWIVVEYIVLPTGASNSDDGCDTGCDTAAGDAQ